MKRCSICGQEVEREAIQCPKCGRGMFEREQQLPTSSKDTKGNYEATVIDNNNKNAEGKNIQNIHDAVSRGDLPSVKAILAASPNLVHSADGRGWLPLHSALNGRHGDIARLLVERGADVNRDCGAIFMFLKPLHIAAAIGDVDLVRFLISKGAVVDCTDLDYRTPLLMAVDKGHNRVAELLVASGAKNEAADITGRTPISLARDRHNDPMIGALTKTSKNPVRDNQPRQTSRAKWWQFWK